MLWNVMQKRMKHQESCQNCGEFFFLAIKNIQRLRGNVECFIVWSNGLLIDQKGTEAMSHDDETQNSRKGIPKFLKTTT